MGDRKHLIAKSTEKKEKKPNRKGRKENAYCFTLFASSLQSSRLSSLNTQYFLPSVSPW